MAANLGLLSKLMEDCGGKIPILGEGISAYGKAARALLDSTKQAAITIDKKRNQGAISGQGYYKAGHSKEKYEKLLAKYPDLANNYTYLPKSPYFVYESVEPGQPTLIWDEESKDFYRINTGTPVESIYKMRLLTGKRSSPYELKVMSDKWETVGGVRSKDAMAFGTLFETMAKTKRYSDSKKIFWEVRDNNSYIIQVLLNDMEMFQAKYIFDANFKQSVHGSLVELYNKFSANQSTEKAAASLYKFIKKYNLPVHVKAPPSAKKVEKPTPYREPEKKKVRRATEPSPSPPKVTKPTPQKKQNQRKENTSKEKASKEKAVSECYSKYKPNIDKIRQHNSAQNPSVSAGGIWTKVVGSEKNCMATFNACMARAKKTYAACPPDNQGTYTACMEQEAAASIACALAENSCAANSIKQKCKKSR